MESVAALPGPPGKARGAARAEATFLGLVVDSAPVALVVINDRSRIVLANARAHDIFGYRPGELVAHPASDLVPAALRATSPLLGCANEPADSALGAGFDCVAVRSDGDEFPVIVNWTTQETARGSVRLAAVIDISEQKKASLEQRVRTAELEGLNAELESFSYSVSHDLRAPLRAVLGYARAIETDYGKVLDDEGRRLLSVVHSEAGRMGELIDDLLAFSRLGRQALKIAPVDMGTLVREVIAEQGEPVEMPGPAFDLSEVPDVPGDRMLLRQAWFNLISNAIKYSGKRNDARIKIWSTSDVDRVTYHISDNGVGFDMKYAGKLFGVFQRLHRSDEFPGTGVGLAIVQRIIHRHGGSVWADAQLGSGATFSFSLPAGEVE